MDAMTRMKIAWASFLLLFLLLFTCHSPVSAPFPDQATLTAIRNLLHDLPDPGLPQSEMTHIFHYDLNRPGPLQQAYDAQPQLYATVLFTVFRDHLTRVTFAEGENGQRDRLLVLLKGHRMLPKMYAGRPQHRAATVFDILHTAWTYFLAGAPLPGAEVVQIPIPIPDADQNVPLPEVIQPLFVWVVNNGQRRQQAGNDVQMPTELPYRELLRRFLEEYVANYNVDRDFLLDFTRFPSLRLRTAVLKALYWMLVVRPFQAVVAARPDLFPGVNAEQLLPALNRRLEGGGGRPRPLGPVPLIPDPPPELDDLDPPVQRGPDNPDRIEDIFRDQVYIREIAVGLQRQQIFRPTVEAVRALYEPGSALQQAMNTAPPLYAAVLFTVFRGHFAEVAFAEGRHGRRNHLLVLLHDLRLLPTEYGPGEIAAVMNYDRLEAEWQRYLQDDLVLPQLMEVINDNVPRDRDRVQVTVPAIFRPLFREVEAQRRYSVLKNRFLDPYVRHYTLQETRVGRYLSWRHRICPTRRSHLLAIFWMVVVRPFQQAVIEHRRLFPNGEGGDGGPGDGGGGPGGGRGGGRGGPGGGNRGGGGARGGRAGRGGGEGDDPPPPPRPRPPQNPPSRRNPPQNRQPAQPSCSSSAALSTARTSRSQQGTCSAAKAPTRIQPGRAAKTGSKHPAPDEEEEEEEEEDSDEDSDDDDDGPSLPPAKRPRRRDHPPRDPDAGGAGAGMTF